MSEYLNTSMTTLRLELVKKFYLLAVLKNGSAAVVLHCRGVQHCTHPANACNFSAFSAQVLDDGFTLNPVRLNISDQLVTRK